MTRKALEKKIALNEAKIKKLQIDNRNLFLQSLELSDKYQWYIEEERDVKYKEGGKTIKAKWIIGMICWNEDFVDEDNGEVISIERAEEVKRNGIWIV